MILIGVHEQGRIQDLKKGGSARQDLLRPKQLGGSGGMPPQNVC